MNAMRDWLTLQPRLTRRQQAVALGLAVAMVAPGLGKAAEKLPELPEVAAQDPRVARLLADYTFSRRVVSTGRVLDRRLHEFLLTNPDIGAALARLQGLGTYRVQRLGPGVFEGTDGEGAWMVLEILAEAPGRCIFYARGRQVFRLLPDISGEALVVLTTRYEEADGADLAHGELEIYARLDNRVVGGLLPLLLPFVGWILDQKISKAFLSESRSVELLSHRRDAILAQLEASDALLRSSVARFRALLDDALEKRFGPEWLASREGRSMAESHDPVSRGSRPALKHVER